MQTAGCTLLWGLALCTLRDHRSMIVLQQVKKEENEGTRSVVLGFFRSRYLSYAALSLSPPPSLYFFSLSISSLSLSSSLCLSLCLLLFSLVVSPSLRLSQGGAPSGMAAVARAMTSFPGEKGLQAAACGAVLAFVWEHSQPVIAVAVDCGLVGLLQTAEATHGDALVVTVQAALHRIDGLDD